LEVGGLEGRGEEEYKTALMKSQLVMIYSGVASRHEKTKIEQSFGLQGLSGDNCIASSIARALLVRKRMFIVVCSTTNVLLGIKTTGRKRY